MYYLAYKDGYPRGRVCMFFVKYLLNLFLFVLSVFFHATLFAYLMIF